MVDQLTEERITQIKEAFLPFDKNGDGTIHVKQLETVMKSLRQNPTKAEIKDIINDFNIDEDGTIDFHKFLSIMARRRIEYDIEEKLLEAFKSFDENGIGLISLDNFKLSLLNLSVKFSVEETQEIITLTEAYPDGKIDYEELLSKLMSL